MVDQLKKKIQKGYKDDWPIHVKDTKSTLGWLVK